jgi:hypothetical protein
VDPEVLFDEKTRGRKSRETVPLKQLFQEVNSVIVENAAKMRYIHDKVTFQMRDNLFFSWKIKLCPSVL